MLDIFTLMTRPHHLFPLQIGKTKKSKKTYDSESISAKYKYKICQPVPPGGNIAALNGCQPQDEGNTEAADENGGKS